MTLPLEWLPIESAPKDGTQVMLWLSKRPDTNARPEGMWSQIVVGAWRGRKYDNRGWWISDIVSFDHGYYQGEFDWEAERLKPTHWMRLPDPPPEAEIQPRPIERDDL